MLLSHLKKGKMDESELKNKIRKLIGEDKLEDAIELLIINTERNEKIDEIILQQARYSNAKKETMNGITSLEETRRELNILRKNLLLLVRSENLKGAFQVESLKYSTEDFEESLAMSLTRIRVAEVLISHYDSGKAITISNIMNLSKLRSRKLMMDFLNELKSVNFVERKRENKITTWKLSLEGKTIIEKIMSK